MAVGEVPRWPARLGHERARGSASVRVPVNGIRDPLHEHEATFQSVTPDARTKSRFVIVDAVGVTESDLSDTQPLDRKPTVPLDRLFKQLSFGSREPDVVSTIAGRIARLERQLTKDDRDGLLYARDLRETEAAPRTAATAAPRGQAAG